MDKEEKEWLQFFKNNFYGIPLIDTPFGKRHVIYADFTASGQPAKIIEDFLQKEIYPYYANTHSNAYCGRLMAHYIEKSKHDIRNCIGAKKSDMIIYTGYGSSTAITHFIHLLDIFNKKEKPVVFLTDFEHNSNFLPWKYVPVELEIVSTHDTGLININHFKELLNKHKHKSNKIVSFSAGSNITGIIQNTSEISILSHKYGCIVSFDYAAVGPYVKIDLHKQDDSGDYIDAIFISPHKFFGGPGTPGILVCNDKLFINKCPFYPSGGTVRFCSSDVVIFSENHETRESGGTPHIIGCIRAGLTFKLKEKIFDYMINKEEVMVPYIRNFLNKIKNVYLLVPNCQEDPNIKQVPIFPFIIPHFHYNYIVVLLNDLFGIQTRGGVACSGIYAEKILHLTKKHQKKIISSILKNGSVPSEYGWIRVTFHYTMSFEVINYILNAIKFVAKYGLLFLPFYNYVPKKNLWEFSLNVDFKHLSNIINAQWKDDVPSRKLGFISHCDVLKNINDPILEREDCSNNSFTKDDIKKYLKYAESLAQSIVESNKNLSPI
jgi:selenocysteine lyase/cysteine desulfurase